MDTYISKLVLILLGVAIFFAIIVGHGSLKEKGENLFQSTINQTVERKVP